MNEELKRAIYVSINPKATAKIVQGIKNHEFRNYAPKDDFRYLFVYVTSPQSELKYVIEIGKIVKFPEKLESIGDGNIEFNLGKKSKYAYPITKVFELARPISLEELKNNFDFFPPQAFSYAGRYEKLTKYLQEAEMTKILSRENV